MGGRDGLCAPSHFLICRVGAIETEVVASLSLHKPGGFCRTRGHISCVPVFGYKIAVLTFPRRLNLYSKYVLVVWDQ